MGYVVSKGIKKSLFDANSILKADIDNTPVALTIEEQRLLGRITSGNIAELTANEVKTLLDIGIINISGIPGTIASILTDHNVSAHNVLDIDADTLDGADSGIAAEKIFKIPAGIAHGEMFYVNTSGNIVRLGVGTDGYFLQTKGVGADPIWAEGGAGVSTWIGLTDTPNSYSGKDGYLTKVDSNESALQFLNSSEVVTNALVKAHFPDTTANILSDHNVSAHNILNINASTVNGISLPNTITSILTDHNVSAHNALNIDADTVDGEEASAIVTKLRVDAITADHGSLSGKNDDDHTQYHNDVRGDIRYLYKENISAFTPDGDYEPATKKYVDDSAGVAPDGQLFLTAAGGFPSTTNGCAEPDKKEYGTNDVDMYNLAFDNVSDEFAQWTVAMPSDWDAGTVTAVFYWTCATGNGSAAETVKFHIQGRSYADNDALDQAFGMDVGVLDTWIADNDLHTTSATGAATIVGAGASELVQFRIHRNTSEDTLHGDALLLGTMITFNRS